MTLGYTENVTRNRLDAIPIPETVISQVNALGQVQPNYLELIDQNKRPIGELDIIGVDYGETYSPHIGLVEPETDLEPVSVGSETLPELV